MTSNPRSGRRFGLIPLDEVKRRAVPWLWPGWVPANGVTVLPGDPKLAKSTLALDLAARLSRKEIGDPKRAPTSIVVTGEDSVAEVVEPRVAAAGGKLYHVHVLDVTDPEAAFTLPEHVPDLEHHIFAIGAQLAIIDPLNRFLAESVDGHRDQSLRRALGPLQAVAERQSCAILVVAHLNKGIGGNPLYRVGGSIGLTGAARSVMLFAKDPDDPEGERGRYRILAQAGSNYGRQQPSRRYKIEPTLLPASPDVPEVETIRLIDEGEVEIVASDLLAAPTGEERTAHDEAADFLRGELAEGPRPAKEIMKAARELDISERTLKRAKAQVGVESTKGGLSEGWIWALTEGGQPEGGQPPPSPVAPFDKQAENEPFEWGVSPEGGHPQKWPPSENRRPDDAASAQLGLPAYDDSEGLEAAHVPCSCAASGDPAEDGRCSRCWGWPEENGADDNDGERGDRSDDGAEPLTPPTSRSTADLQAEGWRKRGIEVEVVKRGKQWVVVG